MIYEKEKIVYFFDDTGLYIGDGKTQIDILESEKQNKTIHLMPKNATFKKPQSIKKDEEYLLFDGINWNVYDKPDEEKPKELTLEELEKIAKEKEYEIMIYDKLKEMAIKELIKDGKLDKDGKIK